MCSTRKQAQPALLPVVAPTIIGASTWQVALTGARPLAFVITVLPCLSHSQLRRQTSGAELIATALRKPELAVVRVRRWRPAVLSHGVPAASCKHKQVTLLMTQSQEAVQTWRRADTYAPACKVASTQHGYCPFNQHLSQHTRAEEQCPDCIPSATDSLKQLHALHV